MNTRRNVLILSAVALLAGCQTIPPPATGKATLAVMVVAEPKTGVVTGNTHVLSYDSPTVAAPAGVDGQFEKVDYAGLDQIVVWVEPADRSKDDGMQSPPAVVEVHAGASDPLIHAVHVGQQLVLFNAAQRPMNLYSVSDANEFDLGVLQPGAEGKYILKSPGLVEVLTDSMKEPVTTLYCAPTAWVMLAHAGQTVRFPDLPPGHYTVHSWHPRLPGQQITVTLLPDKVVTTSIKVGVNSLPKIDGP